MTFSIRDLGWLALALGISVASCSSGDEADDSGPAAGKGGAAAGTGGANSSGGDQTGSGGTGNSGSVCPPSAGAAGEAGQSGAIGTSGAAGEGGAHEASAKRVTTDCGPVGPLPALHVEGNEIKDPSGNTVVLRGVALVDLAATEALEGGVDAMIDRVTDPSDAQGSSPGWATKVVRLMVTPADATTETPEPYTPGGDYYERILRPAVDYARSKGLYSIIDWHYIDSTSLHVDTTTEFWTDIAPRFAGDPNVLFELYNEPINGGSWDSVRIEMQGFYDTVRAGAPDNLVLAGTPNWCQFVGDAAARPLDGTNVAYVAHMYPQQWALPALRTQIADAAAQVPVFITAWGFEDDPTNGITNGTVTDYAAPFKAFIEEQKVSWTASYATSTSTWGPPMFDADYNLLVGESALGGFAKDWLYEKRNDDLPMP